MSLDYDKTIHVGPYLARLSLQGESGATLNSSTLEQRLAPFVCHDPRCRDEEDIAVALTSAGGAWPRPGRPMSRSLKPVHEGYGNWRVLRNDIDAALTPSICVIEGEVAPSGAAVEACLQILLWLVMADDAASPGLLIRAATTVHDGKAYIFAGHAGSGKSTLVQSTPGQVALCDALSLLTQEDGEWRAWPSPFWGWSEEHATPIDVTKSYPVGGLAFLEQGPATRLSPLRDDEALTRLVELVYTFDAFPISSSSTFELAADLLQTSRLESEVGILHVAHGDDPYQAFDPNYSRAILALPRPPR